MKKLWNTAFIYFWLAMAGGVFYREFTKFNDYSGKTVLGLLHVHLLVLGTLMFLSHYSAGLFPFWKQKASENF